MISHTRALASVCSHLHVLTFQVDQAGLAMTTDYFLDDDKYGVVSQANNMQANKLATKIDFCHEAIAYR